MMKPERQRTMEKDYPMKPSKVLVAIALLVVALYGIASAAENSSTKTPPAAGETKSAPMKAKKAKPAAQKFRGAVTGVDSKAGTLSVKSDADEKSFIAQDSVKESIERLTVGNRVKITYTEKEGKLFASSVRSIKIKNADATKTKKDSSKPAKTPAKDNAPAATK
jgi:hypothetical protein